MRYNFLKAICLCCFMHTPTMQAGQPDTADSEYSSSTIQAITQDSAGHWPDPAIPVNLSEAGHMNIAPQIAVDADGIATVVWTRYDQNDGVPSSYSAIQALTQDSVGHWPASPPMNLSGVDLYAGYPQIAINGNKTVVWNQNIEGQLSVIQASTETGPGAWSGPTELSEPNQDAVGSQIAVDANGIATAVWMRQDENYSLIIQALTQNSPGVWPLSDTAVNLSAPGQNASFPQIAVDGSGIATAVWAREDENYNLIIQALTQSSPGVWPTPAAAVNLSAPGQDVRAPQIIIDANGLATAVWARRDENYYLIIQAITQTSQGTWPNPAAAVNLSASGKESSNPQIAVDADGNTTAVWMQMVPSTDPNAPPKNIIQTSTQTAPGVWSPPVTLSAPDLYAEYPQIAVDGNGIATAVWSRKVFYQTIDISGAIVFNYITSIIQAITQTSQGIWPDPAAAVNLSASDRWVEYPQIAVDADGIATAVWRRYPLTTITSVTQNFGPAEGGAPVTITGTYFFNNDGIPQVKEVKFGAVSASFTVDSVTSITAIAPPAPTIALASSDSDIPVDITVVCEKSGISPITSSCQYTYQSQSQPPLASPKFKGDLHYKKHAHKHKHHLKAHWKPSRSNVPLYRIYKRSKVVATVPADSKLVFKTHLLYKSSTKKFSVAAVNAQNEESARKKLQIE